MRGSRRATGCLDRLSRLGRRSGSGNSTEFRLANDGSRGNGARYLPARDDAPTMTEYSLASATHAPRSIERSE
jgi:hypothetical protein